MLKNKLSRRTFLSLAGVAGVGAGVAAKTALGITDGLLEDLGEGTVADEVVPSVCEICFWKCGILAHKKEGRVFKITGNPAHPLSRGRLCPRGAGGPGLLYDKDRLTKPLIRVGERGEEQFREATWEEALDRVAEGFQKVADEHGPEAVGMLYHGAGASFFKTLLHGFGTPNIAAPSYAQCRGPREVGFELTYGEGVGSPENLDMRNTRTLVLIGAHLGENMHNTQVQDFAECLGKGAKLIVADPRYSTAAGKADWWLPVRPGTDIALIMGWINVILREGWYDKAWMERNTIGLDKLEAHAARYTPEAVFVETGIEPKLLVETAEALAATAPASLVHPGRRVTWYGDDAQRSRAIAMLNALLGNWGRPGGFIMTSHVPIKKTALPEFPEHRPLADKLDGQYVFAGSPLASGLRDATLAEKPYPIKAWMVYGCNLPNVLPDTQKTLDAIQKLDFMVAVDVLPAEICGWADVVLPECTYLERHDDLIAPWYREPYAAIRQPVVDPIGDSKPGWWMAKELAKRLGLEQYFPWESAREMIHGRLKASGLDAAAIANMEQRGVILGEADPLYLPTDYEYEFGTPSGKIEFYSRQLADAGFDPIPTYRRPEMPAAGSFRLLTGRAPSHTFGRTANNSLLLDAYPENELWVNRVVAGDLGLKHGSYAMVRGEGDAVTGPIRVKVTERIRADCVYMVHGFGHSARGLSKARGRGANDSAVITKYKTDPLMGGTGFNVNFVRIEPAPDSSLGGVEA